jgi:DNA polymerase-3 subunit epsilon
MRVVVLDTETTGLRVEDGHRIIEIGCLELINRRPSGRRFHELINPEREIEAGATEVHGFRLQDLEDKPLFASVAERFISFVEGAQILIHNAPFDTGFINAELARMGRPPLESIAAEVVDTLRMARDLHPGQRNSLDALCQRYGVNNAHRLLHGALLDAELLAEVWLAMTRGQDSLDIQVSRGDADSEANAIDLAALNLPVVQPSAEEWAAHERIMDEIAKECGGTPIWRREAPQKGQDPNEVAA